MSEKKILKILWYQQNKQTLVPVVHHLSLSVGKKFETRNITEDRTMNSKYTRYLGKRGPSWS